MVAMMINQGISRQHQLHRPISVTSCSGLFSPRICRSKTDFFEGDLQIGFSVLYCKRCARHSVDFVLLGSPQWHHGGCVFGRLLWWESMRQSSLKKLARFEMAVFEFAWGCTNSYRRPTSPFCLTNGHIYLAFFYLCSTLISLLYHKRHSNRSLAPYVEPY